MKILVTGVDPRTKPFNLGCECGTVVEVNQSELVCKGGDYHVICPVCGECIYNSSNARILASKILEG